VSRTAVRVLLWYLLAGLVWVFVTPLGPYFGGIVDRHGGAESEILYGWPAYWLFLPAMAWTFAGFSIVITLAVFIYEVTREHT
jgi:hypothetical protein